MAGQYESGDRFTMGAWGGEPITWRVLEVGEAEVLAVSECGLDCVKFNESRSDGNAWETSHLKAWLEQTFLPQAFTESERTRIREITCLTVEEAERFFPTFKAALCEPTEYAVAQGVYRCDTMFVNGRFDEGTHACHWWLRDPGIEAHCAAEVGVEGLVFSLGWPVDVDCCAVRPAIRLAR
ncbi:MAG: hypothetical protein IKD70_05565, partial [Eggerthellaceae bacterium]|nr:hypothetical protein [Eggerthellaceae bacterium]